MMDTQDYFKAYEYLPQGIFVINKNYEIIFWNKSLENLTGINRNRRIGSNLFETYPHLNLNKYKVRIKSVLEEGTNAIFSSQLHKYLIPVEKDIHNFYQHTIITPYYENNEIKYAIFNIQDVTDEVRRIMDYRKMRDLALVEVEERKRTEEALKKSNLDKDKFFSIIAHDLKSPFVSLLGFSEFLYKENEELSKDEIQEYSHYILDSSKKLFNLLENLLEWSRIQTGHLKFDPKRFVINSILRERVDLFKSNAYSKGIDLIFADIEDIEILADENMIDTVIRNFISNALKYTATGGFVMVRLGKKDDECIVSVKDNGMGMNETILNQLFKVEHVKSREGTAEEKGTGLGLVLCKEMINKNKGKIWVESTEGEGSKFSFSLPL